MDHNKLVKVLLYLMTEGKGLWVRPDLGQRDKMIIQLEHYFLKIEKAYQSRDDWFNSVPRFEGWVGLGYHDGSHSTICRIEFTEQENEIIVKKARELAEYIDTAKRDESAKKFSETFLTELDPELIVKMRLKDVY